MINNKDQEGIRLLIDTSPNQGYCASQSMHFYGYKLHAVCSFEGIFHSLDLTKASVHDIKYLEDVKHQINDFVLVGDKGYLSSKVQLDLFEGANIELSTPKRKNQLDYIYNIRSLLIKQ